MSVYTTKGTALNFKREVLESPIPVLVEFQAPRCDPCRLVTPLMETFGDRYTGRVKVVKVDVDEEPALGELFGVRSIPTLIAFHQKAIVGRLAGYNGQAQIRRVFDELSALPRPDDEATP